MPITNVKETREIIVVLLLMASIFSKFLSRSSKIVGHGRDEGVNDNL